MTLINPAGAQPSGHGPWLTGLVAAGLQLTAGVPYLFSFLLAPGRVVLVLWATWLGLSLVLFGRWRGGAGPSLLLLPPLTFTLWFVVLALAPLVIGHWSV